MNLQPVVKPRSGAVCGDRLARERRAWPRAFNPLGLRRFGSWPAFVRPRRDLGGAVGWVRITRGAQSLSAKRIGGLVKVLFKTLLPWTLPFSLMGGTTAVLNAQTAEENDEFDAELIIVIRDELRTFEEGGNVGLLGEQARFHYWTEAFSRVLDKADFPTSYAFRRWPAKVPERARTLEITMLEWELQRIGDIETRFWALLEQEDEKINLGVYFGRHRPRAAPSTDQYLRDLKQSVANAVEKLVPDLADAMKRIDERVAQRQ